MDFRTSSESESTLAPAATGTGYFDVDIREKEWKTFICVPSRFAMLGLTCLLTLTSLTSLIMGSVLYNKLDLYVTDFQQVAIIMHLFVYSVLVFFCGFGLYTVIYRCRQRGSNFCAMLLGQILFEITSGSICLYFLFNDSSASDPTAQLTRCMEAIADTPQDLFVKDLCYRAPIAQGVCLAIFLFLWVLQLFTFYASNRYVSQLQEEYIVDQARGKDEEDPDAGLWK
ncbi:hypothetical protein DFP72DRAFT_882347, partial [Ephemerocybe angulata]